VLIYTCRHGARKQDNRDKRKQGAALKEVRMTKRESIGAVLERLNKQVGFNLNKDVKSKLQKACSGRNSQVRIQYKEIPRAA